MLLYPFKKTVIRDFQGFEKLYKHCKKKLVSNCDKKINDQKKKKKFEQNRLIFCSRFSSSSPPPNPI